MTPPSHEAEGAATGHRALFQFPTFGPEGFSVRLESTATADSLEIKLSQLFSRHLNCDLATLMDEISSGLDDVRLMFLIHMECEEFEKNQQSRTERIFDHIEVPRARVELPLLKSGDMALADLVENYDEVKTELKDTHWAGMLN